MGGFLAWGKPKRAQPARVPTDEVFKVSFRDNDDVPRGLMMGWMMQFNCVLDGDKLRDSLVKLINTGDWRKLGARCRLDEKGWLELHIPKEFTDDQRPALRYETKTFDMDLRQHPLGAKLPRPTEDPSIQPHGTDLFGLSKRSDQPETLEDYLCSDLPLLGLYVVYFRDATLVTLSWPHTLMDGLGRQALVRNWCHVLAGREDKVQPLLGLRDGDPLDQVSLVDDAQGNPIEYHMKKDILRGFALFLFTLHFLYKILLGPKMDSPQIYFIPAKSMARLRRRATDDLLDVAADPKTGEKPPFLSDGDILTALFARLALLSKPPMSNQPVSLQNSFEIRTRLPDIFDPEAAYLTNLVFLSATLTDVKTIRATPLGKTALVIRQSLVRHTQPDQVRANVRESRKGAVAGGRSVLVGRPGMHMVVYSNWTKGRFFDVVDFGPAVVNKTGGSAGRDWPYDIVEPGKPVMMLPMVFGPATPLTRNMVNILGKDAAGNYWVSVLFDKETNRRAGEVLAGLCVAPPFNAPNSSSLLQSIQSKCVSIQTNFASKPS